MTTINNKFKKSLIIAGLSFFALNANAGQAEINLIEQATSKLDITALQDLTQSMSGYDLALNQYRLALSANLRQQSEVAKESIDKAISELEELDSATPDNVEIKALLAQSYGYKIALEPIKGIYYGPKAGMSLQQAEAISASNPRVLLVKGISAYNTPAAFGGSVEVAFDSFNKAIESYPDDIHSDYHWGHAEAYTWRGLVYQQQGDMVKAKADWQKAVEIEPNYGWATSLLAKH